ncbi:MAG: lipopolysaccharide biosynthesis protein [Acidiferrobacter sp.]
MAAIGTRAVVGVGRAIIGTTIVRILSALLGMVSLALTAHWLGPAGRGTLVTISTWVALFATLGSLSLGQVAIHRSAGIPIHEWLAPVMGALLLATIVTTLLGWLTVAGLYALSGHLFHGLPLPYLVTGFFGLPLVLWEQYNVPLLMAVGSVSLYNRYQILGRLVGLVALVMALVFLRLGVEGALWAWMAANLVLAVGGFRHLWRLAGRPRLTRVELLGLLVGGAKLHLNAVGNILFSGTDVLLLHYFRGPVATGYYQTALQLTTMFLLVPQAATMILYSKVSADGPDRAWRVHRQVLVAIVGLMAVACLVAYAVSPWAMPVLLGARFAPSVGLFRWLLLGVLGMTFSTLLAPQWIGRGLFWQASLLTLAVGIANVALNLVLIPRYGALGAVWGTLAVYMFSILGNGTMALYCEIRYRVLRPII